MVRFSDTGNNLHEFAPPAPLPEEFTFGLLQLVYEYVVISPAKFNQEGAMHAGARKKGMLCIVGTAVRFMQLGVTRMSDGSNLPSIQLSYDADTLLPLSILFSAMKRRNVLPKVHIWVDRDPLTEVAVIFELDNPEPDTCRLMSPYAGGARDIAKVICIGEIDIQHQFARAFVDTASEHGKFCVFVTENGTEESGIEPVASFEVSEITHQKPWIE